jgi:hypothetical protein
MGCCLLVVRSRRQTAMVSSVTGTLAMCMHVKEDNRKSIESNTTGVRQ